MDKTVLKLSVFFEDPFWIGVFEKTTEGKLSVAKVTFGAEPKDYDIYEFILKRFYSVRFSPAVKSAVKETAKNPKRVQRQVKKQLQQSGIGTKSQQALKLQQEQNKLERKSIGREKKEAEKQRQFDLKQLKRKEKHRGR